MLVNIFGNDDAVIHKDSNHQDHSKQGNHVDGYPQMSSDQEHAHEGNWNGQRHPKGDPDIEEQRQEQED